MMDDMNFNAQLRGKRRLVNNTLRELLASQQIESRLKEALRYTLEAPGKRIRSVLVLFCCELLAGKANHNAEIAAAALEMVHTYSLVHDDLPAMDNDDLRRGRPTCHKAFDEATAILAGDALLTLAFEILARQVHPPALAVRLIGQLAEAAGPAGMIAGQFLDVRSSMTSASSVEPQLSRIEQIHTNKTAKMFQCAAAMGGICGGADENQLQCLREYGLKIGLGFQIADDILDVCGSSQQLGKTAGKDAAAGKITYPAVVGLEKSRQIAKDLADQATAALAPLGPKAHTLRQLAIALLKRTR
jgi:geranylgeranyl diphosphate synthase type II